MHAYKWLIWSESVKKKQLMLLTSNHRNNVFCCTTTAECSDTITLLPMQQISKSLITELSRDSQCTCTYVSQSRVQNL